MTQISLARLVEDLSVYPRAGVSPVNVSNLVQALKVGATLPSMIVDRDSKRIVDGFHRRRALMQVFGSKARVDVEMRRYGSEAEMLAEAISLNAEHGLPLGQFERRQAVLRLGEMGVDDSTIAVILRIPEPRVQQIQVQVSTVVNPRGAPLHVEVLKRPLSHFQGRTMSEEQAVAQRSAPGSSYGLLIRQLSTAMQLGLINRNSGKTIAALQDLRQVIDDYLASSP